MTEPQQTDIVSEARAKLAKPNYGMGKRNRELMTRLCDEVERLRRGEFTPEEFQNLCHNTDAQAGFDAFANGCEAYQQKLFGRCRKGTTT